MPESSDAPAPAVATAFGISNALAEIALSIPMKATSGDLIQALVKAEAAGYERRKREHEAAIASCVQSFHESLARESR